MTQNRILLGMTLVAFILTMVGTSAWAAPIPSQSTVPTTDKPSAETAAAERELVKGQLMAFGLTDEQATARVGLLTDAEVHAIAADLDSLQTAGEAHVFTTTEILLAIIVLILILD